MKLDSYWTDSAPAFVPEARELPAQVDVVGRVEADDLAAGVHPLVGPSRAGERHSRRSQGRFGPPGAPPRQGLGRLAGDDAEQGQPSAHDVGSNVEQGVEDIYAELRIAVGPCQPSLSPEVCELCRS